MKLSIEQIKEITTGAEEIDFRDGKFVFSRFIPEEKSTVENSNVYYQAGICLNFRTDASRLRLKVFAVSRSDIRSFFAVDIYKDGEKAGCIRNFEDGLKTRYAEKEYPCGEFEEEICLGAGEKTVKILLPHSIDCSILGIELENAGYITPVKREKTLLMYGDSITQGYDALYPSDTYAVRLSDMLDATLINKGLGGDVFNPDIVKAGTDRAPDYVTAAYGINDWATRPVETIKEKSSEFVKKLAEKYPTSRKFVITPIWTELLKTRTGVKTTYAEVEKIIEDACKPYPEVKLIRGYELVPHSGEFFGDIEILHPNAEGFKNYADNLFKEIKE